MTKLHENIKMLCKQHKISVLELERRLSFSRNTITAWRNSMPTCDKLIPVASYFDVSVDFLLGLKAKTKSLDIQYSPSTIKLIEASEATCLDEGATEFAVEIIYMLKKLSK